MKKILLGVGTLAIVGYLGTVGYIHMSDKSRSEKLMVEATTPDLAMRNMFYQKGCDYCHTSGAELPFYTHVPGVKQLMEYDIRSGTKYFSLEPTLNALKKGEKVPEADLAKIETAIATGLMPLQRYTMMHWSASLDEAERAQIVDWVKSQRSRYYQSSSVADSKLQPLPDLVDINHEKVELGNILYHDTRLSSDNTVSCATCHPLNKAGVDGDATSTGVQGQKGGVNAPTVYNAVFNAEQFWDGRAADLQKQAGGPPLNPVEMASTSWDEIIAKLSQDTTLTERFNKVYPEGYTGDTITDAIAEFEKTLITPNSPFDKYMKGDKEALTPQQLRGYTLFKENKCDTCHVGQNIGGQSYDLMGLKADYFADRKRDITPDDRGRYNVTKDPRDMHRFKTPGLRNIAHTGPYFHDAAAADLNQAVTMMLKYQVGKTLPDQDVKDIVAFLESLTGEMPAISLVPEE